MPTPGIGDPYWYEWYVGLRYIIKMINPDSNIKYVVFQNSSYDTIDDVVVKYNNSDEELCFQVKHQIMTSQSQNFTFNDLIKNENKKSLLYSLFNGWEKASNPYIKPILFTNKKLGLNKTQRNYNGESYSAYPLAKFLSLIKREIDNYDEFSEIIISDQNLLIQFNEFCNQINTEDKNNIIIFIKSFEIHEKQPNLSDLEAELINDLEQTFCCSESIAKELFCKLAAEMRIWATSRRSDERITIEKVFSALNFEEDINESQHRLIPPHPFFESRKEFCKNLKETITNSNKNIIFLTGNPGSGKTSLVSYLQSEYDFFLLRYHTFRPISPNQHFYNVDTGLFSAENLWGSLLIQLRKLFAGNLAKYNVPVYNKLLTAEEIRKTVLKLLGIYATDYSKKTVYVCIDGIDHAARAKSNITFLNSLPKSNEIPANVCFVIVGQPTNLYQEKYPLWLSSEETETFAIPNLDVTDIKQLIDIHLPNINTDKSALASLIYEKTEGNNLSTVFVFEEIKQMESIEEIVYTIQHCGINADVEQYYSFIWERMKQIIAEMSIPVVYPESLIASPILLMNGRINSTMLSHALIQYKLSDSDWRMILDSLYPLLLPTENYGEYSIFHNDFRVFLMGIISRYNARYEEIALLLAKFVLEQEDSQKYILGIPLLQCANKTDLIPKYISPDFIIGALAKRVSKQRLDDYLSLSFNSACQNRNLENLLNTYLSIKTLHQHIRYFEYYDREYISYDFPEIDSIDISEIRTLPLSLETLFEYKNVLELCKKLNNTNITNQIERSNQLYNKWFGNLSPYNFISLCDFEEESWKYDNDEVVSFLKEWGKTIAEINIRLPIIDSPNNKEQCFVVNVFGTSYFNTCITLKNYNDAVCAIKQHYVNVDSFFEKLDEFFLSGNVALIIDFLPIIQEKTPKPVYKLFALAILVMFNNNDEVVSNEQLVSSGDITYIIDETSFEIVLRSFLIGYKYRYKDDQDIIEKIKTCTSSLEDKKPAKKQMEFLSSFAGLLGKNYWYEDGDISSEFSSMVSSFLSTRIYRRFDHSKAIKFLIYALLFSPLGNALSENEIFVDELCSYLFNADLLEMYYKTIILDHFLKINRCDIIENYILELYGEDCRNISIKEQKLETHNVFMRYGEKVCPDLIEQFSSNIKWDVVGYIGSKEYILQMPYELFASLLNTTPEIWCEYGKELFIQSSIANISNNGYYEKINESLVEAAIDCGLDDYWNLINWDNEFQFNPNLLFSTIISLIKKAVTKDELVLIWILCTGIHSWYTNEERLTTVDIYEQCINKASELEFDFNEFIEQITPQWLRIIEHEIEIGSSASYQEEYNKKQDEKIKKLETEYRTIDKKELINHLIEIPILPYARERYCIVIEIFKSDKSTTEDDNKKLLESVCSYIKDTYIDYESFDDIINYLLDSLGIIAFWSLVNSLKDDLSKYSYYLSIRNIQKLFKLYIDGDYSKQLEVFRKELNTQNLWISGNHHISLESFYINENKDSSSHDLIEIVFKLLIAQLSTQNSRKIETALFALRLLGQNYNRTFDMIVNSWSNLSEIQKDWVLFVVPAWIYSRVNISPIIELLRNEYESCVFLSRKYYIHSILCLLGLADVNRITYNSEAHSYDLPKSGEECKSSIYSTFLNHTITPETYKLNHGVKRLISSIHADDTKINDKYTIYGDVSISVANTTIEQVLYQNDKKGMWDEVPLYIKKSSLLPSENSWIVSGMPTIIYEESFLSFFNTIYSTDVPSADLLEDKAKLLEVSQYGLTSDEVSLATTFWLPIEHNRNIIYYYSTKITANKYPPQWDHSLYSTVGNYELIAIQGEYHTNAIESVFREKNLFYLIGGSTRFYYGNCQFAPSNIWKTVFKCNYRQNYPYILEDEKQNQVLRFEQIATPIRECKHEIYSRQPIIFRWVCDKKWLEDILEKLDLLLFYCENIEHYDDDNI